MATNKVEIMPVRNMPSKVPAPPMLTTDDPKFPILLIFNKSAPINTPNTPEMKAIADG
jgi:hypothetical protein